MTLSEQKKALRRNVKDDILKLSGEYCRMADHAIFELVTDSQQYKNARTIFCFVGTASEINTIPIILDALKCGKRVGVPRCLRKGIMEVYEIRTLDDLEEGSYGILEPNLKTEQMSPEVMDLALVPCLSCNDQGKRLGYGGGFYDRYLAGTKVQKMVLCRDALIRKEIPTDSYDLIMDYVVTEKGIVTV